MVLYVWLDTKDNSQRSILYFWQGAEASSRVWPMFLLTLVPNIEQQIVAGGYKPPQKIRVLQQKVVTSDRSLAFERSELRMVFPGTS